VEPVVVFGDEGLDLRLGGVTCIVRRVGGDHALDSCAIHVVEDGLLFLGDCLYERLHAPEPHYTVPEVRALTDAIEAFGATTAIQGHADEMLDAAALSLELGRLRSAADRVERLGDGALATAGDDSDRELLGLFLAGR
jgi:glyoxylase-like metal-dependent hydrolase (beta-lactamase superfamily II)